MERICKRCEQRPAHNTNGPAVCLECRRTPLGVPSRPQKQRTCRDCGKKYKTTGGNLLCSSCLHQASKTPCEDCGVPTHKKAKVCMRCWGKRNGGAHAPQWKGGRITRGGYQQVSVPGHPRGQGPTSYVRVHHIVMEERLGRYLLPGETVHHINGVRSDNRPENLELWVTSQPAGQRAVDLLAWARQIIATYEPVEPVILGADER